MSGLVYTIAYDAFWSAFAALGFAMLFNVPKKLMPSVLFTAAVGHASYTFAKLSGVEVELGALIGATVIGFLGLFIAKRYFIPAQIITISAAIPMVPGGYAYKTVIALLTFSSNANIELFSSFAVNASKTALILCAIAIGITMPSLLFRRYRMIM